MSNFILKLSNPKVLLMRKHTSIAIRRIGAELN